MNITPDFLQNYYQNELSYLRSYFREYSAKYPEVSKELGLDLDLPSSPDAKLLYESFALLTARIHKRLDDSYPQIRNSLMDIVYPDFLRPVPSVATVQFEMPRDFGGDIITIDAQTELGSTSHNCRFRTTQAVNVRPIDVINLKSPRYLNSGMERPDEAPDAKAVIELELECKSENGWSEFAIDKKNNSESTIGATRSGKNSLRFFLGVNQSGYDLYELLFSELLVVKFESVTVENSGHSWIVAKDQAVRAVGFEPDNSLIPQIDRCSSGFAMLKEFFAYPAKFLYFDLFGFDKEIRKCQSNRLRISFFLRNLISEKIISIDKKDNFLLHCSPVVNLFKRDLSPITLDHKKLKYPVFTNNPDEEIYSIDKVTTRPDSEDTAEFLPFFMSRDGARMKDNNYWVMERRRDVPLKSSSKSIERTMGESPWRCFLSFYGNWQKVSALEPINLFIDATCTNSNDSINKIFKPLAFGLNRENNELSILNAPVNPRVRRLDKPSETSYAPQKEDLQWDMINLLSLNYFAFTDSKTGAERLRNLMKTMNFYSFKSENNELIKSLEDLSHRRISMRLPSGYFDDKTEFIKDPSLTTQNKSTLLRRPVIQGIEITLSFRISNQFARSRIFLLGSILNAFFGLHASINAYSKTIVNIDEKESIKWEPRVGLNPIV